MARSFGVVVAVLVSAGMSACMPGEHALVGEMAPEFSAGTLDDGTFRLSDHRGKHIVILDFWATWCGPCRESMPTIIGVAKEYASQDVVLYTVNQGESKEQARAFIEGFGPDVKVILDSDLSVGSKYKAEFIPQTVLIDKEGRIQAVHVGADGSLERSLRKDLELLTAGKSLL